MDEQCSKCRPSTLGVDKKLRLFERLIDENGDVRANNILKASTVGEGEVGTDEIERGVKALTLEETETISAPEPQPQPQFQPQPKPVPTEESDNKIPENESILEQTSESQTRPVTNIKAQRWIDACPSVENGKAPLSAKSVKKGLLSRIFSPFGKGVDPTSPESEPNETKVEDARAEGEDVADGVKVDEGGKRKDKGWVKVKDDPDWEVVSDEERKGAEEALAREGNQKS